MIDIRTVTVKVIIIAAIYALVILGPHLALAGTTVEDKPVDPPNPELIQQYEDYNKVVQDTIGMTWNQHAQELAQKYGLNILNVTWEDTGRYKNSCVGPNISDMTIQVQLQDPRTQQYFLHCMPVIRFPNFSDKTCDVNPDKFYVLVGNEKGKDLKKVSLREFLGNMRSYLNEPDSWKGDNKSLLADRDTHFLVSAQACFLPIPKKGDAEFNPVLFNYQSYPGNPAVLTILATREGTSVTIIDNQRDAFAAGMSWGQRLFFNQNGERASLNGKRMSDFLAENDQKDGDQADSDGSVIQPGQDQEGLSMVLLIQVPLKHNEMRFDAPCATGAVMMESCDKSQRASDVESAVIGHGKVEGPFTEIDGMAIERDPRFPVRVTIQFYKATSNGEVSGEDMEQIAKQLNRVYDDAEYVGSLVVEGDTQRPTEYDGDKVQPADWWEKFWQQYEEKMGISREEAMEMLIRIRGLDRFLINMGS